MTVLHVFSLHPPRLCLFCRIVLTVVILLAHEVYFIKSASKLRIHCVLCDDTLRNLVTWVPWTLHEYRIKSRLKHAPTKNFFEQKREVGEGSWKTKHTALIHEKDDVKNLVAKSSSCAGDKARLLSFLLCWLGTWLLVWHRMVNGEDALRINGISSLCSLCSEKEKK